MYNEHVLRVAERFAQQDPTTTPADCERRAREAIDAVMDTYPVAALFLARERVIASGAWVSIDLRDRPPKRRKKESP